MNTIAEQRTASLRIKSRRALMGYTQSDMADKLGISRATYIKLENNPYCIKVNQLEAVALVLGCTVSDFIMG